MHTGLEQDSLHPAGPVAQAANAAGADYIKDGDMQSFGPDVIEQSMTRPVIVDFWADWCGPCRQLMPALEAAVQQAGGAVALVKVNADQNQALCGQLQVQSLPTVLAFWQGQPVDGFQGAVPGSHIQQFIDRLIQMSGSKPVEDNPIAGALDEAEALLAEGERDHAKALFGQILGVLPDPNSVEAARAMIGYGDIILSEGDKDGAQQMIDQLPLDLLDDGLKKRLETLKTALELAGLGQAGADLAALTAKIEADPQDHQARYDLAEAYIGQGDKDKAAESLLASIMRDREWNDGACRQLLLKLFDAAGMTDPFTIKYRRRLSSVLFS